MIGLAILHVIFPKYFDWAKELKPLNLMNRQMMYVHTFFVAFIVFLMGVLCLTSSADLLQTNLGKKVLLGFGIFWFARLLIQFLGYSSELWRGKRFETAVHIAFVILWMYLSTVFFYSFY